MKILYISFSILLIFLSKLTLSQNCNLYDKRTGDQYDFSLLSAKSYSIDIDNRLYLFSICNTTPYCLQNGMNISACYMSDGNINTIGQANDYKINTLDSKEGGSIEYKISSDFCQDGYVRTRVEMICDDSNTSIDKVEEDSLCSYNFIMRSPFACPIQKSQLTKPKESATKDLTNNNDQIVCVNSSPYYENGCFCLDRFTGIDCSVAYNGTIKGLVQSPRGGYPTVYFSGIDVSWTLTAYTLDEVDEYNQIKRSLEFNKFHILTDQSDNWTGNYLGITVRLNITNIWATASYFGGDYLPINRGSILDSSIKGYSLISPTNKLVLNFKVDASNIYYGGENQALLGKPNGLYYAQNFKNLYYFKNTGIDIYTCDFSTEQLSNIVNLNYTFTLPNGINEVLLRTIHSAYNVSSTNTPRPTSTPTKSPQPTVKPSVTPSNSPYPTPDPATVTFEYTIKNYTIGEEAIIETNTKRYASMSLISMIDTVTSTNKFRTSTVTTVSMVRNDGSAEVTVSTTIVDNSKVFATIVKPSNDVNSAMKINIISNSFIISLVTFIIFYLI